MAVTGDDRVADDLRAAAARRPPVRVNQVGYLPDGPKQATVVTDHVEPLPFRVRADTGEPLLSGRTRPWPRPDPSCGLNLHVVDFSDLPACSGEVRLEVGAAGSETASWPFPVHDHVHTRLLEDALLFFYAQRSGVEIRDDVLPGYGRPAGHVGVPPNRGDLAVRGWSGPEAARLYPGWQFEDAVDVSGGWYDAGDHGKYVVSGGFAAALLLFAHGRAAARGTLPSPTRPRTPTLLQEAMWHVDWALRMQVPQGDRYAGMAFHRVHDESWTPLPLAPHEDPAPRVLHRPSTAATLSLAGVAAQAAGLHDPQGSERSRLLRAAWSAYAAARREPALTAPDDRGAFGGGPYDDLSLDDDFYWAATELFLATGDVDVLTDVLASPCHTDDVFGLDGFGWNDLAPLARLRLAVAHSDLPDRDRVRASVVAAADRLRHLQRSQPWGQPYAPDDGWDWGSTGQLLTNLIVLATAHDLTGRHEYLQAARSGLDYLFGRNPVGLSFVTGHGTEFSHRQRVRHFGHALDPAYPPPPPGSLAGGPASKTYPGFPADPRFDGLPAQFWYVDEPTSETTNDVCVRWNAALVWMAAFLSARA